MESLGVSVPTEASRPNSSSDSNSDKETKSYRLSGIVCARLFVVFAFLHMLIVSIVFSAIATDYLTTEVKTETQAKNSFSQYTINLRSMYPHKDDYKEAQFAFRHMTETQVSKFALDGDKELGDFDAFRRRFMPKHVLSKVRGIVWDFSEYKIPNFVYDDMGSTSLFPLGVTWRNSYSIPSEDKPDDGTVWERIAGTAPGTLQEENNVDTLEAMSKISRRVYKFDEHEASSKAGYEKLTFKANKNSTHFENLIAGHNNLVWIATDDENSKIDDSTKTDECKKNIDKHVFGGIAYLTPETACDASLNDKVVDGYKLDDRFKRVASKKDLEALLNLPTDNDQNDYYVESNGKFYHFKNNEHFVHPRVVFDRVDTTAKNCQHDALTKEQKVDCIKYYDILSGVPVTPSRDPPMCKRKSEDDDTDTTVNYGLYSPFAAEHLRIYEYIIASYGDSAKEKLTLGAEDIKFTVVKAKPNQANKIEIDSDDIIEDGTVKLKKLLEAFSADKRKLYQEFMLNQTFYLKIKEENYNVGCIETANLYEDKTGKARHIVTVSDYLEPWNDLGPTLGFLIFVINILIVCAFIYRLIMFKGYEHIFERFMNNQTATNLDLGYLVLEIGIFFFLLASTIMAGFTTSITSEMTNNFPVACNYFCTQRTQASISLTVFLVITLLLYAYDSFWIKERKFFHVKPAAVYVAVNSV